MAEAFLNVILTDLYSLIKDEVGLILGVDEEMNKLKSILTTIQAVLEDAEQRQLESEPIRNWLIKLSDLTYEIDDVLDECATHVSKSKHRHSPLSALGLKEILDRDNIGRRMKKVFKKLDDVAAERKKFHLRKMDFVKPSKIVATRETGSILSETHLVFGREKEREEVVDILVDGVKDNQEISILPIVGLGGLGKTTLAQLVFNDDRVIKHFDIKLWVCVSDNFDLKTIVKVMIESASGHGTASDLMHLDTLQRRLWSLLDHKRYLLVLDDVWNDNQEKWFMLRNVLACGLAGSSIITTTRLRKVAEIMRTLPVHNLKGLSEEHCWSLLKYHAFGQEEEGQFQNLEAIGRQIVKKCAGVPLAAKALGGLLRFKRTEKEWIYVKESEIWNLPHEETSILPALRLSYHHIPLELRQCFAYCSIHPKGTVIVKHELIWLWMAHGYILSNGILEAEDIGEQILNELIVRSLFENVNYDGGAGLDSVRMHDLVHDLAQSIMENNVSGTQLKWISTSEPNSKIREVNLSKHFVAFPKRVQTEKDISFILKKYNRLRVLDAGTPEDPIRMMSRIGEYSAARKAIIKELPPIIGNLKHLRLLNLSGSEFHILPNSLCSLWNLQVLILNFCENLEKFPKNMRHLKNLRHLLLEFCTSLNETPSNIRELTCLRSLGVFIVGSNKGNQLEELQLLKLGGNLEIKHLERVKNPIDAKKANLAEKNNLLHLSLVWEVDVGSTLRRDTDEKVLEMLQPNPNIEKFRIIGFSGTHFPSWTNLTLENLDSVEIVECHNLVGLCPLAELRHLKFLLLLKLDVAEYMVQGGSALSIKFPALEMLVLDSLPNLKGIFKDEVREMCPNLRSLIIQGCPSLVLAHLPKLEMLERLEYDGSLCVTSFVKLDNLACFKAKIGENMKCIPHESLECLTNLKSLWICNAHEHCLPVQGLQGLNSLQQLQISSKTMTHLPKEWLCLNTTLEELYIHSSPVFIELPEEIRYLQSLRKVIFSRLPKMVSIPEAIRHLSSLEALWLGNLHELTMVPDWLSNLTSLRYLRIIICPKLTCLPSCIKGMSNLHFLEVLHCPHLTKRYEKETGEDWHKIAHIPNLDIRDD